MKQLLFNSKGLILGKDSIGYLKEITGEKCFIVTGKSAMFRNGTIDKITEILNALKIGHHIHSGIGANPTEEEVIRGKKAMLAFGPDIVIGVGGGSAIDATKVMTIMYENPELTLQEIREGKVPQERIKAQLIAIPSTSGTATEVTKAAVITFKEDQLKVGLKSPAFIPDIAILDSNITLSMPEKVVAESGMDAITHALETYINPKGDDLTNAMAKEAAAGLINNLQLSYDTGKQEYREKVHHYQALAGIAFTNTGLGMDHGIAHTLGGMYNYSHGLLNAIGLPYVLEYNSKDAQVAEKLLSVSKITGENVIEKVRHLNRHFNIPVSLREMGLEETIYKRDFAEILRNSLKGSTVRNPIKMTEKSMTLVLNSMFYGEIIF
jgi:hypothetical protein